MSTKVVIISLAFFGIALSSHGNAHLNQIAPDFELIDQTGVLHRLSSYRGEKVVVYFYPKDDTPGCTTEACSIRDDYTLFLDNNIRVFGISYDSPASHAIFVEKYGLPFTLLSDTDKSVSKDYGSAGLFFPSRRTFLINEQGIIIKIYEKVTVTNHGREILNSFLDLPVQIKD